MTQGRLLSRRHRSLAVTVALLLTLATGGGAVAATCWSIGALRSDLAVAGTASTTSLHLLTAALGLALAWATLVLAVATGTLTRVASPHDLRREDGRRRAVTHHVAALVLAVTGVGVLGSAPAASAMPLSPPIVQQEPADLPAAASAMALPLPLPSAAPVADSPGVPQPGWVTPPPSPLSQRCRDGARLIAGLASRTEPSEVVVHRGDSLWILVSRYLRTNDACAISAVWPQWYAANRTVIGDDPDLLRVGQRLRIPAPEFDVTPDHATQGER